MGSSGSPRGSSTTRAAHTGGPTTTPMSTPMASSAIRTTVGRRGPLKRVAASNSSSTTPECRENLHAPGEVGRQEELVGLFGRVIDGNTGVPRRNDVFILRVHRFH